MPIHPKRVLLSLFTVLSLLFLGSTLNSEERAITQSGNFNLSPPLKDKDTMGLIGNVPALATLNDCHNAQVSISSRSGGSTPVSVEGCLHSYAASVTKSLGYGLVKYFVPTYSRDRPGVTLYMSMEKCRASFCYAGHCSVTVISDEDHLCDALLAAKLQSAKVRVQGYVTTNDPSYAVDNQNILFTPIALSQVEFEDPSP